MARRRLLLRATIVGLGPALLVGASIGFVLVMVNRLADTGVGLAWLIVAPLVLAATIVVLGAIRQRPTLIASAQEVDSNLRLSDRLSTAMAIAARDDPFSVLAIDAGKLAADTVDVHRAIAVRFGRAWRIWPLVLLCAVVVGVILPHWSPKALRQQQAAKEVAQRTAEVAARVDAAIETAREATDPTIATTAEQIRSLEELRRELEGMKESSGTRDSAMSSTRGLDDAVSRTAESLEKLAKAQEMAAGESQTIAREVEERLADLPRASTDEGTALSRAVRSGDLDAARKAASELVSKGGSLTAQERESVARDLQALAEDLRSLENMQRESSPEAVAKAAEASSPSDRVEDATKESAAEPSSSLSADDMKDLESAKSESSAGSNDVSKADSTKPASRADEQVKELQRRLKDAVEQLRAERREEEKRSEKEAKSDAKSTPSERLNSQQGDDPPGTGKSRMDSPNRAQPDRDKEPKTGGRGTERATSGVEKAAPDNTSAESREPEKTQSEKQDVQAKKPGTEGARDAKSESAKPKTEPKGGGQERGQQPQAREANQDREQTSSSVDGVKSAQQQPSGSNAPAPDPSSKDSTKEPSTERAKSTESPEQRAPAESKSPEQKGQARPSEVAKSPSSGGKEPRNGFEQSDNSKSGQSESRDKVQSPTGTKQTPSTSEKPEESQRGVKPSPSGSKTNEAAKQATASGQESGKQPELAEQPSKSKNQQSPASGSDSKAQTEQGDNSPRTSSPDGTRRDDMPGNRDAMKRLQEQIERMGEPAKKATKQEQSARTLRERANEMYRSASPADQEKLQRWVERAPQGKAQEAQGQGAGGKVGGQRTPKMNAPASPVDVATTPIDARKPAAQTPDREPRDQVVAEWLGDGEKHRGLSDQAAAQSRLQQAAESAEQAIGDRTVPSRYDRVLREYFKRLPGRVLDRPVSTPTPAAAPAMDAP